MADIYRKSECMVLISQDPVTEHGILRMRMHLSISCTRRYPTWDEIKDARYSLLDNNLTMAMMLPPMEEYVNLHNNCFHLYEIE